MKKLITTTLIILSFSANSQVSVNPSTAKVLDFWAAKEFSKDVALFRAKSFLYSEVLGADENVRKFELIPLAAATSGELTTLLYKSEDRGKEGMILGFFGEYWNEAGVIYQGYKFKNLTKEETFEFLEKISNAIEDNSKFLKDTTDNNNIYFSYKDIDVLITASYTSYSIRLLWNRFDSSWEKTAFDRSKRRFERKIK